MMRSQKIRPQLMASGLGLLVLVGCNQPNAFVEPPPPEVTVENPVRRAVTEYLEFTGLAQPVETVEIRARVTGFLKERHFVEGATVKKGQLLLVIDEEPYQIRLDSARAQLLEAQAALEQARVSRAREVAQSQVTLSQSQVKLALQESKRVQSLFEQKATSQAMMDEAAAVLKAREAELESARASLSQANATYETTILSSQARLESAETAVRSAELDLSYCRITAPIDGQISRVHVDAGNLISEAGNVVLATIVQMNPMHAYATISEADLAKVPSLRAPDSAGSQAPSSASFTSTAPPSTSQSTKNRSMKDPLLSVRSSISVPADLGLPADENYPIAGRIDYTDPGLDPETGTLRIRGVFPNVHGRLLPGMFVKLRVSISEADNALLVSERALGTDQSGRYVLVVDEKNRVQYRSVKTGVAMGTLRVVQGDLKTSDQIIVEGLLRARPGAKVVPVQSEASSSDARVEGDTAENAVRSSKAAVADAETREKEGPRE